MQKKWFTLIEILIVIVIIWLLAFTLIPRILAAQQRARDTGRIADVRQIGMGLQSYIYTNNTIPNSAGTGYKDISSISGALLEHLKSIPDDKWRGLMVNSDGHCISSGDNYAYFPSLAENSAIATAAMEWWKGNTANCRGIVSTKMSFPRHSDGYNITPKDYSPWDVLMNNPHPICTHPNMTVPEIECEALMAFYDSTGWPNRTTNTNRWTSPDVESWFGIQLTSMFPDSKRRVKSILLWSYWFHGIPTNEDYSENPPNSRYVYIPWLVGTVPDSLSTLVHVQNLALWNNPNLWWDMNKFIEDKIKIIKFKIIWPKKVYKYYFRYSTKYDFYSKW